MALHLALQASASKTLTIPRSPYESGSSSDRNASGTNDYQPVLIPYESGSSSDCSPSLVQVPGTVLIPYKSGSSSDNLSLFTTSTLSGLNPLRIREQFRLMLSQQDAMPKSLNPLTNQGTVQTPEANVKACLD